MARIRTIKPEILEDERTAGLSDAGFRMFVAMVVLADDYGNLRADSRWLEGQVWWARGNPPRVAEVLREVSEAQLVELYVVRGQTYCHIRSWEKHQRIDNAGKARVPRPSDGSPISAEIRREIPLELAAGPRPPTPTPISMPESANSGDREEEWWGNPQPKPPAEKPRATRKAKELLPDDWLPERSQSVIAAEDAARARGVDLDTQLAALKDWAKSNNEKKADWNAAWRNWTRNAKPQFNGGYQQRNTEIRTREDL